MTLRLTHHSTIAQGNRRNAPVPPSIQCLIQEGITNSSLTLDKTGNVTTTNNGIVYASDSSSIFNQLPTLKFDSNRYVDVPILLNTFNGTIHTVFKVDSTISNATIWSGSNDLIGNFGYALFFLNNRILRVHNGGTYYDINDHSLPLGRWIHITQTLTPTKVRVRCSIDNESGFLFEKEWDRLAGNCTAFIRLGQHSRSEVAGNNTLYGSIARFIVSGT